MDTTRADALGCYGVTRGVTPELDALRARGVLFEEAFTVAPLTLVAHASMLTGLYPVRHGVRDNGFWPLSQAADTVAELAAAGGYDTGAFLASSVLGAQFGLDQGFATFDAPGFSGEWQARNAGKRPAADVVDAALAWLRARDPARPFFLWVHLFDPHSPYLPGPDVSGVSGVSGASGAMQANPSYPNPRYLGEVADMDRAIGRLLDGLEALERDDETLILAVADHGESLMAHDEETHGVFCYQETMRVPLLLCLPDGERAGETARARVSVVDVFATLADVMDLPLVRGVDGKSLLSSSEPADRGVYFECYAGFLSYGWSPIAGWVDDRGKVLFSSRPELYDLAADPREEHNLACERPADVERYRAAIRALAELHALTVDSVVKLDDAAVQELAKLGYAGVGLGPERVPEPLAETHLPSPADMRLAYATMQRGIKEASAGRFPEAEQAFREVLAKNPRNYVCLDLLAFSLMQQDRHAEAIAPLQQLVHEGPEKASWFFNLGVCLHKEARFEQALAALTRAVELDPSEPRFRQQLEAAERDAAH